MIIIVFSFLKSFLSALLFATLLISIPRASIWLLCVLKLAERNNISSEMTDYIDGAGRTVHKRAYIINGEIANGFVFIRLIFIGIVFPGIPAFIYFYFN